MTEPDLCNLAAEGSPGAYLQLCRLAAGFTVDDVALLLYRHPGPLELEFPAEAGRLAPVRSALRGWLERD